MYGMTRLSAVIYNLKKDKYKISWEWIKVKTRFGNELRVKSYILIGKEEE